MLKKKYLLGPTDGWMPLLRNHLVEGRMRGQPLSCALDAVLLLPAHHAHAFLDAGEALPYPAQLQHPH